LAGGAPIPWYRYQNPRHAAAAAEYASRQVDLPNGVKLVVTSTDAQQVIKLKALGFMGIMVQGHASSGPSSHDGEG
jgi:hypothetical protein